MPTRQAEDYQHRIWQRRLWSTLHGKTAVIAGTGIVGAAIGELLKALGMHVVGVTRTPRQVEGFDEMMPVERLPRGRGQGRLSHQCAAGERRTISRCSTPRCSPR